MQRGTADIYPWRSKEKKKKNGAKNADLIGDLPVEKILVFNGISLINLSLSTSR